MFKVIRRLMIFICLTGLAACSSQESNSSSKGQGADLGTDYTDLTAINGATGVSVDQSFVYTFQKAIDPSSLSSETFFIQETSEDGCDVTVALDAAISYLSSTRILLNPTDSLEEGTSYTVCIIGETVTASISNLFKSRLLYSNKIPVETTEITFTTEGEASGTEPEPEPEPTWECSASTDCENGELCYYGICKAYADVNLEVDCTEGGSITCAEELGGDEEDWACLPVIDPEDGTCALFYCASVGDFFNEENGYLADQTSCEAVDGFTWMDSGEDIGYICLSEEIIECFSSDDGGGDDDPGPTDYDITTVGLFAPNYATIIDTTPPWPLNLTADFCETETIRITATGDFAYCSNDTCLEVGDGTDYGPLRMSRFEGAEGGGFTSYIYVIPADLYDDIETNVPYGAQPGSSYLICLSDEEDNLIENSCAQIILGETFTTACAGTP